MTAQGIIATCAFSFRPVPGRIRVIGGHLLCKLCRVRTKILFVNDSGFVDNKSHYTGGAVVHRVSNEGESSVHLAIDDIVFGSARCMWSLACEDPEHISIERNILADLVRWDILARISYESIHRPTKPLLRTLPAHTIVPSPTTPPFL